MTGKLAPESSVFPDGDQIHYLRNVMRLGAGDVIRVFNGEDGEWEAELVALDKKRGEAVARRRLREQAASPDLWLLFAPVKRAGTDLIVEKATELGVSRLCPVQTARSQATRTKDARLNAIAREAAEQCERLDLPVIDDIRKLDEVVRDWPDDRRLFVCAERSEARTIADACAGVTGKAAVLIGPEGGFGPEELDRLARHDFVTMVTLGPRILRAETAAIAAIACWQAVCGDWTAAETGQ